MAELKMEKVAAILRADDRDFLKMEPASVPPPSPARIRSSVRCAQCGERFMESRARVTAGKVVCMSCFEKE
jgi:formylmethanofuran dehydrogenase subunit E